MRNWGYRGVFGCAGVLLAACAVQPKIPPPSTDIDEAVFRQHVRVLASDDFEGRRPGTPGEDKTVAYLVEQFSKLGLKPGNGESYLQAVPMTEYGASADASLAVTGKKRSFELVSGKDMIIWSKRGLPQAELPSSELVFVGYGIVAPEYAWNDYAGIDVRGKTVLMLVNDPGYATQDPKVFRGGTMTYYGDWSYKIDEAARQGAAGVLLIHDADAAGYAWDVVQSTWGGAQYALGSGEGGAGRAAIEGWLQADAARDLFAAAGLDFAAVTAAAAHPGFKAAPLGLQVQGRLHTSVREFVSHNVIALWPGGSQRHEYVLYGAHWDHLGRDPARSGHNIFNGAVDNASGVAGLLTLAQSFVRTKPRADRSVVFLALTGAESGLLGSQFYVNNPVYSLRNTVAELNLDTLRIGGPTRDVNIFGSGNTDLEQYARAAALLQGREVTAEPAPQHGLYFRSDSLSFANAGVPALYARAGSDDTARGPAWGRAQLADYMAHRYHRPADQYSPDWDVRGALDDLTLYYAVGLRLAHTTRFPRWYPNSEFRVSRERPRTP
ncbi:MAG: M28 family metallopeptidase [Steroidobacteraceae bacterium]